MLHGGVVGVLLVQGLDVPQKPLLGPQRRVGLTADGQTKEIHYTNLL